MGYANRWESIYIRLLKLLVLAGAVSCLFFFCVNRIAEHLIDNYYVSSNYKEKRDREYLSRFQTYVKANQISARDTKKLKTWVDKQKIISLQVYRDNVLLFDSEYLALEPLEEKIDYASWKTYYILDFADGKAEVSLYGFYFYQLFNWAFIGELLLAFVLFVTIVLLGIRKTMQYIRHLSREIGILEGGNLDYAITVTGKDELAALARGLEEMRRSFRHKVEQETHLVRTNQRMITEMSHDLRTPLTSIMLYTEILRKRVYSYKADPQEEKESTAARKASEEKRQFLTYIEKIEEKTVRIKQMAEHLFEYVLIAGETETELEEPALLKLIFYDLLSETCAYLEQNGFTVTLELSWESERICVNTGYVLRIMDNITSNLLKYGDREQPVCVRTLYTEQGVGLLVENAVRFYREKVESTGIGLGNMKNMMAKMNGCCKAEERDGRFAVTLIFPRARGINRI